MGTKIKAARAAAAAGSVLAALGAVAAAPSMASATTAGPDKVVYRSVQAEPGANGATKYTLVQTTGLLKPGAKAPAITPDSATSNCKDSNSLSVDICGTIVYEAFTSGGSRYAYPDSFGNKADRFDGTARMTDIFWSAGQLGRCYSSCGVYSQNTGERDIESPSSGVNYSTSRPWPAQYTLLLSDPNADSFIGLNQDLKWFHGSSEYDLTQEVYVPAN